MADDLEDALKKLTSMFNASQKSNSKAAKEANKLAKKELDLRNEISRREVEAANQRSAQEIAARLQISNNEQAAAMARLEKELQVRREDMEQQLLISRERLGFDREQLAANIKIENDKLLVAREEMEKIGIPKMLADKWYQEQQVALAQSAQQIDREKIGVERGRLGFDVMSKAIELASSPATRYQFGDFAQSLARNPNAADWLRAMAEESQRGGFAIPSDAGVQAITPEEAMAEFMGMLGVDPATGQQIVNGEVVSASSAPATASLTGAPEEIAQRAAERGFAGPVSGGDARGAAAASYGAGAEASLVPTQIAQTNPQLQAFLQQQEQELKTIGDVFDKGAHALAPGTLEGWGEDNVASFISGGKKLRRDTAGWLRNYERAGVHQASGAEAA